MAIINAADTSQAAVSAAISAAVDGDTVMVPAGSSTWASELIFSGKAITLQGAGIGLTNITDGQTAFSPLNVNVSAADFVRVTGFTFIAGSTHSQGSLVYIGGPQAELGFRIDHCRFLIASPIISRALIIESAYGLIDHCVFDVSATSGSIQSIIIYGSSDGSDGGFTPWTRPLTLGSNNAAYIEDNTFTYSTGIAGVEDCIDAASGARLVIRGNIFTNTTVGFHGTDSGDRRSTHSFEIYNNTFINNSGTSLRAGTIRGGTGVFYNNTYSGSGPSWLGITLLYYRACPPLDQSGWGTCNGTLWKLGSTNIVSQASRTCSTSGTVGFNTVDKETLGTFGGAFQRYFDGGAANGYPGRDQPGITTGQVTSPIYVWDNGGQNAGTYDGGYPPAGGIEAWVQNGRDYINNGYTPKPGYTALAYPHPLIPVTPVLGSLTPSSVLADGPSFTLTVNGSGFVSNAAVRWDGVSRTTTFVSATQLTAAILAADIIGAGTASVTVQNNPPSGAVSNALTFTKTTSGGGGGDGDGGVVVESGTGLARYGAVYGGEISYVTAEVIGGGLDIEGVMGDDLKFAIFFGYMPLTGFAFTSLVELEPPPLQKTTPLTVTVLDEANGLIEISLPRSETLKLGPLSGCPWKLSWVESGKTRTVMMGKFQLNRL